MTAAAPVTANRISAGDPVHLSLMAGDGRRQRDICAYISGYGWSVYETCSIELAVVDLPVARLERWVFVDGDRQCLEVEVKDFHLVLPLPPWWEPEALA